MKTFTNIDEVKKHFFPEEHKMEEWDRMTKKEKVEFVTEQTKLKRKQNS